MAGGANAAGHEEADQRIRIVGLQTFDIPGKIVAQQRPRCSRRPRRDASSARRRDWA
jgi:hypothetical protein